MKKVLSLLMMAMLAIGAWAADETVIFSDQGYANQQEVASYSGNDFTVTFDKGTNSNVPKYYTTGAAIRIYGGGYFTVSSTTKTISKIEVGFGSGDGSNTITTDVETYTEGTWEGSASSVKFTIGGTSGHRKIASIAVTFDNGTEPPVTVTPPTFSPAAGEVEAGTAVTISAPDAEMIVYTTDGTAPSYANNNGEIYTEPIVVNEAMTIKAIAVDADENESAVATAAYTIKPEAVSVATVAEFNALDDNTVFTFTGNLVVSAQKNNYLYAQDATGGILIYGSVGQTYTKGNVIPAGFGGKKTTYKGAPELASPTGFVAATTTVELSAEEITPAQVTLENAFKYAVIKGASINGSNLVVGDQSIAYYNSPFGTTVPTDNNTYDVYGINGFYNNPQFLPLEFVEVVEPVHVYTAVGEPEVFFGSTWTPTAEANDMTLNADTGVYEWTSPQATLNAGNKVQFKVVEDHSWDVNYGVDGALDGANVELTAEKTGIYTLTVYFDPQNNNNVTGELTLIEEIVPEYGEFYAVGYFNDWSTTDNRVAFEEKEVGIYEATLNLEAGQEGEFKIITFNEDGSIKWFGGADDNNQNYFLINSDMLNIEISLIDGANFRPEEAGSYTIQIYEKPATAGLMAISEPLVMKVVKNQGTGITSVVNDIKGDNAWYNMQGVRFQNMPAAPGIYIHNGKKVIIK